MDPTVIQSMEELEKSKIPTLKKRYRELFGEESKSSNKQFLFRRIAFRLQANAEGDLSERARRRAMTSPTIAISVFGRRRSLWLDWRLVLRASIGRDRQRITGCRDRERCSPAASAIGRSW
jgi:hypothetical protein